MKSTGVASENFVYYDTPAIYITVKCMEKELNCHGLKNSNNKKKPKHPTTHQKTVILAIN